MKPNEASAKKKLKKKGNKKINRKREKDKKN
jgi:hypothetical protein